MVGTLLRTWAKCCTTVLKMKITEREREKKWKTHLDKPGNYLLLVDNVLPT